MAGSPTLVVAAYDPELAGLGERLAAPIAAGQVALRAIGIGLVEAAAGAERALAELRPSRVILIGTAGTLTPAHPIGSLVVAGAAELIARPEEYLPGPMARVAEASSALATELGARVSAPLVRVASPLGITASDAAATRLGERAAVEQLECFALFCAAARAKVPATALFAIANRVGKDAASEWRTHRVRAEAAAQDALTRALGELSPCPPV